MPWGRPPEAPRRGSYPRPWITQYGAITDLHVPTLRRGNGALPGPSSTRSECCWGPRLAHQVMSSGLGHSRRDWPEPLALTLGAGRSLAACHRMVTRVTAPLAGFKTPILERPPPLLLVDGLWIKIA